MENSGELTGLRNHYFKEQKKDLLVIAEKNSTPNQILEWFVSHFVRNVKMVSKSLRIFFILILFERYHLLTWTYLSKLESLQESKNTYFAADISNGADTKSCVF